MTRIRGHKGFVQIGEEKREVRSLRVTDTTWTQFIEEADRLGMSAGDLFEMMTKKIDRPLDTDDLPEITFRTVKHIDASESNANLEKAIALLKEALPLKANAGGAIKDKIREALELMQ